MKITADTNVLVRALMQDDPEHSRAACSVLEQSELIAIPLPVLCELVWVRRRVYRFTANDCARAIEALITSGNVRMDRQAARAGFVLLNAGGDFADVVIAHGGWARGSEQLVTLNREAARLLSDAGEPVLLL